MKLLATWNAYSDFDIPDDVLLLSVLDNAGAQYGVPGSWAIKWNILHYTDKDGKEQTIKGSEIECEGKRPEEVEEVREAPKKSFSVGLVDDSLYVSEGKNIRRATPEEVKQHNDKWERDDLRWRLALNMGCPQSKVPESKIDEILSKVK